MEEDITKKAKIRVIRKVSKEYICRGQGIDIERTKQPALSHLSLNQIKKTAKPCYWIWKLEDCGWP